MPSIRGHSDAKVCQICGKEFKNSLAVANHIRRKQDHQGLEVMQPQCIPSYADPQFDHTTLRNHNLEWDETLQGVSILEGSDVDEGPLDQSFEGAGGSPSDE